MKEFFKVLKLVILILFGVSVLVLFLPLILLVFLIVLIFGHPSSIRVSPSGFAQRCGFGRRSSAPDSAADPVAASADTIDVTAPEVEPDVSGRVDEGK